MGLYSYSAMNTDGRQVFGTVQAESEEAVLKVLHGAQLFPYMVTPQRPKVLEKLSNWKRIAFPRGPSKEVMQFTTQLAALLGASIPLQRSLRTIYDQGLTEEWQKVLQDINTGLEDGEAFHEALARHHEVFNETYRSTVRAGVQAGALPEILLRLGESVEQQWRWRKRVREILYYPAIVFLTTFGITLFVCHQVIPIAEKMLREVGAELPTMTSALFLFAQFMRDHWLAILTAPVLAYTVLRLLLLHRVGRNALDAFVLDYSPFAYVTRRSVLGRFFRTASLMIESGVPILSAFDLSADTCGNERFANAIDRVLLRIQEGQSPHESLSQLPWLPGYAAALVAASEESATLAKALGKLADDFESDARRALDMVLTWTEPLIIILIGFFVGWVVISLMGWFYIPRGHVF